jgi:hypothetical protein
MTAPDPERSILSSRVDAAAGAARVAPGETVVRYRYSSEAGTSCRHCGATYAKCTEDVLRELHDPKASDGCCDECRDASGHQVRTVLEDRVSVAVRPVADEEQAELRAEVERLRRGGKELGRILDRTLTDALNASGRHDLIGEDGDGDWAVVWETLAELRPRAESAEARLDALVAELRGLADDLEHSRWLFDPDRNVALRGIRNRIGAVLDKHAGEQAQGGDGS